MGGKTDGKRTTNETAKAAPAPSETASAAEAADVTAQLAAAEAALADGQRRAALTALVVAWRTRRLPEIEEVIDVLSKDLVRAYPAIDASAKELDGVFGARAQARDEAELPRLLDALTGDPKGSLPLRLRALLDWPADPRLAPKLLEMIDDPPVTSSSNFPTWTTLFSALPNYVDARAEQRLRKRAKTSGGASKFWPKLTAWIEKAIPALPPVAIATPAARARLAAMKKRAESLAEEAPEAKREPRPGATQKAAAAATGAEATATTKTPRGLLVEARDAIGTADVRALAALVAFWAERRAPEIAESIEALGRLVDATRPSLEVGKPADIHEAWLAVGRTPEAGDVGRLLASLTAGKLVDAEERLTSVVQWPPDPRVGRRLALLFEDFLLGSRPVMWKLIYDAFVRHADPRQRDLLVQRADVMENRAAYDRVRSERTQLRRIREAFVAACERPFHLSVEESALALEIATKVKALAESRAAAADAAGRDERALVRAIADAMDDDAPRAVYADLLTSRGDARGEYIAMALADASGRAKLKSKLAEFAKARRAELLGPLATLVYQAEWRRGLLETIAVTDKAFDWKDAATSERTLSDLRWCTVRALSFPFGSAGRSAQREVLARAPLLALADLRNVTYDELATFAARGSWPHLTDVALTTWARDGTEKEHTWERLDEADLPGLARVTLDSFEAPPSAFLRSAPIRKVPRLVAGSLTSGGQPQLGPWLEGLEAAGLRGPIVEVVCYLFTTTFATAFATADGDAPPALLFHRDMALGPKDSAWRELTPNLERLARRRGRFTWTTKPGVTLHAALVAKLDELGTRAPT